MFGCSNFNKYNSEKPHQRERKNQEVKNVTILPFDILIPIIIFKLVSRIRTLSFEHVHFRVHMYALIAKQ